MNNKFRRKIVDMVYRGRDGHMSSSLSIIDIVLTLYKDFLKFDSKDQLWDERDYFILSKGHGCLALYVVLREHGFLTDHDIESFCKKSGILGEHPDSTKVPGIEASTGSLGHGFPFAVGIALGLRIQNKENRVVVLAGDGECQEGTIWEAAHVSCNMELGNLCVIVDWNGSAAEIMPKDDLPAKWRAFGWKTQVIDGHSEKEIKKALQDVHFCPRGTPHVIIAKTVKGKGVPMLEGQRGWHHRIPNEEEYKTIMEALQ